MEVDIGSFKEINYFLVELVTASLSSYNLKFSSHILAIDWDCAEANAREWLRILEHHQSQQTWGATTRWVILMAGSIQAPSSIVEIGVVLIAANLH